MEANNKPKIAISIGDPNGIGIEVILKSLLYKEITNFFTPIIFASTKLLSYQKDLFNLKKINFHGIKDPSKAVTGKINVVNIWKETIKIEFGKPSNKSGLYSIHSLEAACESVDKNICDILVTAPINKHTTNLNNFHFIGHTEYLSQKWEGNSLMFMISNNLKISCVTNHIPLKDVCKKINKNSIEECINKTIETLVKDFNIINPKIAVLALNPHAGDNGTIGFEENEIILPVIKKFLIKKKIVFGPYPADSFFKEENIKKFDAIISMYHDQGLIPFKTITRNTGVNYTACLKKIRTSPSHGTAYDIAGKNIADETSFKNSIFMGLHIYKNRFFLNKL